MAIVVDELTTSLDEISLKEDHRAATGSGSASQSRRPNSRRASGRRENHARQTRLFAATIFASAFLGFSVQPMIGRMILPKFGGSAAVWSAALLFFQATLLAGYAYAHFMTAWLGVRRSLIIHIGFVLLPLLALPIAIPQEWWPPAESNPIPWLLGYLLISAGLPFLVVSTGAPLFQKWFAETGHPHGRDPYFLYAASNIGSLTGLLSYPILIEPILGLKQQSWFWAAGYMLLAGLTCCCAMAVWRSRPAAPLANAAQSENETGKPAAAIGFVTRLRWCWLAFFPSSLLLGVTTTISTDISPVPLLWVMPLSLYLLTFVIAFGRSPAWIQRWLVWSLPLFIVLPFLVTVADAECRRSLIVGIGVHLATFTAVCLVFHGELARRKPEVARLTEFYLWIAVGGVMGGIFNTLIAPLVFSSLREYQLVLILAGLAMPAWRHCWPWLLTRRREMLAAGLVIALTALLWWQAAGPFWKFGAPLLGCALFLTRPWIFCLAVGTMYFVGLSFAVPGGGHQYYQGRSFFGTFCVAGDEAGKFRILSHGRTFHGIQWFDGPNRRMPTMYYDPTGPIGWVFRDLLGDPPTGRVDRVAVIGLGAGALAAYGRRGEEFTFFEIDPAVEQIARTQFTYLQDSAATCRVVLGDARLSLEREADRKYNLIVVDAFSSDAIPIHLLTREAIELYRDKLAENGVIAMHIANKYLDLEPVVYGVGAANGLVVRSWHDCAMSPTAMARGKSESHWAILSRHEEIFERLKDDPWRRVCRRKVGLWTDDYSNILAILRPSGIVPLEIE